MITPKVRPAQGAQPDPRQLALDLLIERLERAGCSPRETGPHDGTEWSSGCPICSTHLATSSNLSIRLNDDEDNRNTPVLVACHGGCDGLDVLEHLGLLTWHEYRMPKDRRLVFWVARNALLKAAGLGKTRPYPPDRRGMGLRAYGIKERPLYRILDVVDAPKPVTIYVTEGEGKADQLHRLGLVAISNFSGAKKWHLADEESRQLLAGRRVVIIPDNNTAGYEHAWQVWEDLSARGCTLAWISFEDQEDGYDIGDYLRDHPEATGADIQSMPLRLDQPQLPQGIPGQTSTRRPSAESENDSAFARLAGALEEQTHFAVDESNHLYHYENGVYMPDGLRYVARQVRRLTSGRLNSIAWRPALDSGTAQYIANNADALWEQPPEDVMNVQNGLLHLRSRRLVPHTPDHLSTIQLSVMYDPMATCPRWDAFIAGTFPKDALDWGYIIPMWLISVTRAVQKAGLLKGEPGCGKSTYMDALTLFLGRRNVVSKTLQQLSEDRFSKVSLYGRLANIKSELPGRTLRELDTFTSLVTFDPQDAERKGEQSFTFNPFAKLLFSANAAPPMTETGALEAYADRWFVVPFPRRYRGEAEERDQGELIAELTTPQELSGLLNKALDQYEFVRSTRLHQSCWPVSMVEAYQTFLQETVKLTTWLEYVLEYTGETGDRVVKRDLYDLYYRQMQRRHSMALSSRSFFSELKHAKPGLDQSAQYVKNPDDGGPKQVWCYVGWRIREAVFAWDTGV